MVSKRDVEYVLGAASAIAGIVFTAYYISKQQGGGGGNLTVVVNVVNGSGIQVQGAVVTLGSASQLTNSNGDATFAGISPGSYSLTVDALGFKELSESVSVSSTSYSFQAIVQPSGCTPTSCSCGYSFNNIDCMCEPQKIGSLTAPAVQTFNQTWVVSLLAIPPVACTMAYPGSGCPAGAPPCNASCNCQYGDTVRVPVSVSVKDVNGDPFCGVPVSASLPLTQMPVNFPGYGSGMFLISLPSPSAVTDDKGNATFYVDVRLANWSCPNCACLNPFGCKGNQTSSIPFGMVFSAPGVPNALTQFNMQALICAFASF